MSYEQWIIEAKKAAGSAFARLANLYSFKAAFDDGLTPAGAVKDCRAWLGR